MWKRGKTDYFATPFFTEEVKVKSRFPCADFDAVGFFGELAVLLGLFHAQDEN